MPAFLLRIAFIGAVFTAVAPKLKAQATGALRGSITDSLTGRPLVGARVAVWCEGLACVGRHPTDYAGRFSINRLPTGWARFEAHCPSATGLGAEITDRAIEIATDHDAVIDLRVPPGHCDEPAYSERRGVFRGFWTPGFESSAFVPCADSALGVPAPLLPGKRVVFPRAWAEVATADMHSLAWPSGASVDSYGNPTYFVVWRGVLKGPGQYGHMGVSAFSMTVDSVVSVRAIGPKDCRT